MDRELRKAEIIRLVQVLAKDAGGRPPGRTRFAQETGIKPHVWHGTLWRSWGDVLDEAGFSPNSFATAIPDTEILPHVAALARRLGRFPTTSDLKFEASNVSDSPKQKTINRDRSMRKLARDVRIYAVSIADEPLVKICDAYLTALPQAVANDDADLLVPATFAYVYMIRYGKDYKIGRTTSVSRRSRQIQIELPDTTELIHSILTDDPVGIEAYWHRRFTEFRGNGEWFKLPASAIAAFRKWTKIV